VALRAGTNLAVSRVAAREGCFFEEANDMKKILSLAGVLVVAAALSLGCQKKETTTTTTESTSQAPSTAGTPEAGTTQTTTTTTVETTPATTPNP
jgi:hypothetical protein